MQSSYKIIKSTKVQEDTLISPPSLEFIYKDIKISNDNGFNIEEIEKALLKEAKLEKDKIIDEARKEALNIIDNAKLKAEEIIDSAKDLGYQEGYKKGYNDGYEYGKIEAENEYKRLRNEGDLYLKSCFEEGKSFIKKFEKDIIKLSTDIARHIVKTELSLNPEAVYKIAESIISKAIDKKQIILRVNPSDFNIVKSRKEELGIYVEDANNIIILADTQIEQGSMCAETPLVL